MFKIDHSVSARVSKYTYGIKYCNVFNPLLADHLARKNTCYEVASGETWIPNRFSLILNKVDFTLI